MQISQQETPRGALFPPASGQWIGPIGLTIAMGAAYFVAAQFSLCPLAKPDAPRRFLARIKSGRRNADSHRFWGAPSRRHRGRDRERCREPSEPAKPRCGNGVFPLQCRPKPCWSLG